MRFDTKHWPDEEGLQARALTVAAAVAGAAVVGGVYSANKQSDAAENAASAQRDSSAAGIAEQRRQFDMVQQLLKPYVQAGTSALGAQQNLLGLNGANAQQAAIQALQASPQFTSLVKSGENAILQNASATGGLRGGNTQRALMEYRPQLLAQVINDQYAKLGGITALGESAATGTGNAGMQTGNNITNLLAQQGAATAGGYLAGGAAQAGYANAITNGIGLYAGLGGFGSGVSYAGGATPDYSGTNGGFGWKGGVGGF